LRTEHDQLALQHSHMRDVGQNPNYGILISINLININN